jgi:hypothetical protein
VCKIFNLYIVENLIKWKRKKILHQIRRFQNHVRNCKNRDKYDTSNTRPLILLAWYRHFNKSGADQLDLWAQAIHISETMWSCKCFPYVSEYWLSQLGEQRCYKKCSVNMYILIYVQLEESKLYINLNNELPEEEKNIYRSYRYRISFCYQWITIFHNLS